MKIRTYVALLFGCAAVLLGQDVECPPTALSPGSVVDGTVALTDCRLLDVLAGSRTASRIKLFSFELAERTVVTLELNSSDFDPYLYLLDSERRLIGLNNNISATDTNSRLVANLRPGSYFIAAAARVADTGGAFQLKTVAEPPRACPVIDLALDATVEVAFQKNSTCRSLDITTSISTNETMLAQYKIETPRRGVLSFAADALNPLIGVFNLNVNSQFFTGRRSLAASLPAGTFQVIVTSADEGTLALSNKLEDIRPCELISLTAEEPLSGSLADTDCRILDFFVPESDAAFLDVYSLTVAEEAVMTLDLTSGEFDTYLEITDIDGRTIARNDDANGETTDSRLQIHLPRGEYRVLATSFDIATGGYSLKATSEPPKDCAPPVLTLDTLVEGVFLEDGCRLLDLVRFSTNASAARPFHVSVPDRKVGKFDLNVTQGRGALNLVAENGSTAALRNTDADGNAGLELTLPPGEYTLAATSPTAPPPAFALRGSLRTPPECRVEELAAGDPVAGVIESTDCRYFEIAPFSTANTFARQHRFTLGERSRISLTMDSTEIEPVMVLFDANERGLAVGVAPAPGPLRLTGILPAGVYRVVVTAARGGLGAYTIGLQSEAAPEAAPAASPVSIFASSPADTVAAQKFTAASPDSPLRVTAARPIKAKSPRPTDPPTAR